MLLHFLPASFGLRTVSSGLMLPDQHLEVGYKSESNCTVTKDLSLLSTMAASPEFSNVFNRRR